MKAKLLIIAIGLFCACSAIKTPEQTIVAHHIDDDKYFVIGVTEKGDTIKNEVTFEEFTSYKNGDKLK